MDFFLEETILSARQMGKKEYFLILFNVMLFFS